jgi:hypothetical protein
MENRTRKHSIQKRTEGIEAFDIQKVRNIINGGIHGEQIKFISLMINNYSRPNLVPRVFALSLRERNTLEWTYDVTHRFWVKWNIAN